METVSKREDCGGGESSERVQRIVSLGLSRMQVLGSTSVESGATKKPKRDEFVWEATDEFVVAMDIDEREMEMWPVDVKPNSSNSIMSRESDEIVTVWMSDFAEGR